MAIEIRPGDTDGLKSDDWVLPGQTIMTNVTFNDGEGYIRISARVMGIGERGIHIKTFIAARLPAQRPRPAFMLTEWLRLCLGLPSRIPPTIEE